AHLRPPECLAGGQHTEFVALRIGHHHPVDVPLSDVDPGRAKGHEALDFRSLIAVSGRGDIEMEPVLGDLGRRRRAPSDLRTAAVGRADRRLAILIPDQRPSERLAPEVTDLRRAFAIARSQARAVGQEMVPRFDDAELVAFRIGEDDVGLVRPLTDFDAGRTERDQRLDRLALVLERPCRQIEMNAVLALFFSGTGAKSMLNPVSSVGTSVTMSSASPISQRSAVAQKRARGSGSFASKARATSLDVTGLRLPILVGE